MTKSSGATILLAAPVLLALSTGCGAGAAKQAPDAAEPAAEMPADAGGDAEVNSAEPATVDEAAADFESAESSLEGLLVGGAADEPTAPAPTPDGGSTNTTPEARPYSAAGGRCSRACRALASMRRSANRLCGLTSQDDPRCVNVVDRLERAEQRVKANCPSCSS